MTKGRLHGLLGCVLLGLFVSVAALATGAGAASPESVTTWSQPRPSDARPTAAELIASDTAATAGAGDAIVTR